jgi:CheY-like chemotaxis protein
MVVDDEPAALDLTKSRIETMGCEIQAMDDSRAAAERLETVKFEGALVDVVMPRLDGFELTKRIRRSRINREIPNVMLTGLDDVDTMRKGFDAGAT